MILILNMYGGEALIGALVIPFNAIVSSGHIPTAF